MDLVAVAELEAEPPAVFAALADLITYPHWLSIVGAAVPVLGTDAAWLVDLVARVGPIRRGKRVRMVRTGNDPVAGTVRFERAELDGRSHNTWILTGSAIAGATGGTSVKVRLHYGGGRTLPGADRLLGQEMGRAGARLEAYLDARV
ncbi:MAG: SRPBCC family protein [Actinomycetota bacterium]|nr:SRPBCC family protein [Actinomycetota bacterium]